MIMHECQRCGKRWPEGTLCNECRQANPEPIDPERLELVKAALTGLVGSPDSIPFADNYLAKLAYNTVAIADRVLAELRKPKEPGP